MKITIFKKNDFIESYAYGNCEFDVAGLEKEVVELPENEGNLIKAGSHEPYLENKKVKLSQKLKSIKEERKNQLKEKSSLTPEELQEAIKLLL